MASFLSAADDLLTRLLLDHCIFGEPLVGGRRTGKMDPHVREARYKEADLDTISRLVRESRTGSVALSDAVQQFCAIPCVRTFMLKWEEEVALFQLHVRRYLSALRPDSGIAFHETDRYTKPLKSATVRQTPSPTPPPASSTSSTSKAPSAFIDVAVFATRSFKKGEVIQLRGGVADLSEEEDDGLRLAGEKMDFSVLWSSRKNCFSLLLGPARFVNHDCRNNVEFSLQGNSMSFKAIEDIAADEQLFTHYGEHYFDNSNAACLCSTCEQLSRGAFSPVVKTGSKAPVARKRPPSPSRRSSRTGPEAGTRTGGHKMTAQRSLSRRSDSLTSLSSSGRSASPAGSASADEKRRSERTNPVVDEFRTRKRLVHSKLAPPPGYKADYQWDGRRRIAKYIGPLTVPTIKPAPPPPAAKGLSKAALGKRKRAASTASDTDASPAPPARRKSLPSFPFKRRLTPAKKLPRSSLGTRTSARAVGPGLSSRLKVFERLAKTLGKDGDSSSELSDLVDDGDEAGEEEEADGVATIDAEDNVLTDVEESVAVQGIGAVRPEPASLAETDSDPDISDIVLVPTAQIDLSKIFHAPPASGEPRVSEPAPRDSGDEFPHEPSQASGSGGDEGGGGSQNGREQSDRAAKGLGETTGGDGNASNDAGGDGRDQKGRADSGVVTDAVMVEIEAKENEEEEKSPMDVDPAGAADNAKDHAGVSDDDDDALRDEEDREAAALLLSICGGSASEPLFSFMGGWTNGSATTSAAIASTSTLRPIALAYGPSPETTPPSPPKTGTSVGSAESQGALDSAIELKPAAKAKGKGKAREQPAGDGVPSYPSPGLRSTRRNSQLLPAAVLPPTAPHASVVARAAKPAPRRSSPKPKGQSPRAAKSSSPRPPHPASAEVPSSSDQRGTRRTQPIAGDLRTLMASPLVTAVAGGYDPKSKRYFSQGDGKRGRSPSPEVPAHVPAPADAVRGTRRTQPIEGDLRHLLAQPAIASVSGGYDPASGKYYSSRAASNEASPGPSRSPRTGGGGAL